MLIIKMRKIIAGNKIPNILTSTQSAEIMEKNEADFIEGFSKKLIPANKFIIDKDIKNISLEL